MGKMKLEISRYHLIVFKLFFFVVKNLNNIQLIFQMKLHPQIFFFLFFFNNTLWMYLIYGNAEVNHQKLFSTGCRLFYESWNTSKLISLTWFCGHITLRTGEQFFFLYNFGFILARNPQKYLYYNVGNCCFSSLISFESKYCEVAFPVHKWDANMVTSYI